MIFPAITTPCVLIIYALFGAPITTHAHAVLCARLKCTHETHLIQKPWRHRHSDSCAALHLRLSEFKIILNYYFLTQIQMCFSYTHTYLICFSTLQLIMHGYYYFLHAHKLTCTATCGLLLIRLVAMTYDMEEVVNKI